MRLKEAQTLKIPREHLLKRYLQLLLYFFSPYDKISLATSLHNLKYLIKFNFLDIKQTLILERYIHYIKLNKFPVKVQFIILNYGHLGDHFYRADKLLTIICNKILWRKYNNLDFVAQGKNFKKMNNS